MAAKDNVAEHADMASILEDLRRQPSSSDSPIDLETIKKALMDIGAASTDPKRAYTRKEIEDRLRRDYLTPKTLLTGSELRARQV